MSLRTLAALGLLAAFAAPLAAAHAAAGSRYRHDLVKGDLLIIFRGSGQGSYRYHEPAVGTGAACRSADTTYGETDSYDWDYRFVVPPTSVSGAPPALLLGGGELNATEQLAQCAGAAAVTSTCTQGLNTPLPANAQDLAYPNVVLSAPGKLMTVGVLGEMITATPQALCTGLNVFAPNPVEGFSQLQASVSFPRAELQSTGDVVRHFTMAGSGLYAGVALSGSCDSVGCEARNCEDSGGAGSGPPSSCSFNEGYSGTIEVRVIS
jgi:hypothetical protein